MGTDRSPADLSFNPSDRNSVWQKFTYIGDRATEERAGEQSGADLVAVGNPSHTNSFPLSTARAGDRLRIVSLDCGGANARLMGMGLMPGTEFDVISCTGNASVMIALNDHRLGLGADMARCIRVAPVWETPPDAAESGERPISEPSQRKRSHMNSQTETPRVTLRDAAIGSRLRVVGYDPTARAYKRKLLAMGLTPGVEFTVTRHAPLGDPTQIQVRGFYLSLRKDEADALKVAPAE